MTLVSRAIWRAGGHLDFAVDFAIVLVMLLLDLFNPRPVREAALLLHLDSDSDLHGQREHGRNHYSLGRTHLRRAFCTFSKLFGGVWGESWALGFGVREVWGGRVGRRAGLWCSEAGLCAKPPSSTATATSMSDLDGQRQLTL